MYYNLLTDYKKDSLKKIGNVYFIQILKTLALAAIMELQIKVWDGHVHPAKQKKEIYVTLFFKTQICFL